jgi:hypothetical protein
MQANAVVPSEPTGLAHRRLKVGPELTLDIEPPMTGF